ncbi:class I SAM-dependent methyltransferase, partial [Stenotrophomonas sp. Sm10]
MLYKIIQKYWDKRYHGYSQKNKKELESLQLEKWKYELIRCLPKDSTTSILDIGTGPGFFPILLTQIGYTNVTAIDVSENMLQIAQENLLQYRKNSSTVRYLQMNAQELDFEPESFDVIIMRNVTWNLENPEKAYEAWLRTLKPGGQLLIYDANWYSYLNDPAIRSQFENNLKIVSSEQLEDYWHGEGVDEALIEEIARQLPLTKRLRPAWDLEFLNQFEEVEATVDTEFGPKIWSREEELNYAATPMFALYIIITTRLT